MITNALEAAVNVKKSLTIALGTATNNWDTTGTFKPALSAQLVAAIDYMHSKSTQSSTAYTNIITGVAIKAAFPLIDIRYHQEQIQGQISNGGGFSFRTISENTVYPWLSDKSFDGAKSGWQTRTYERDDPYTLTYPHKIGGKNPTLRNNFLTIYDRLEVHKEDAAEALAYVMFLQVEKRHSSSVNYANPRTDNIDRIVDIFQRHFSHHYSSKSLIRKLLSNTSHM